MDRLVPSTPEAAPSVPEEQATDPSSRDTTGSGPEPRKVSSVAVSAFRGIPQTLELSFGETSSPDSVLVLGDNGSGKSSIADAIQFALQAEVRGERGNKAAQLARNRSSAELPSISLGLSDGSTHRRMAEFADEQRSKLRVDAAPVAGFGKTPLVLRRSEILRFWETPAAQRQLVFVRYFTAGAGTARETPQEKETRLGAERVQAKTRRNEALRRLEDLSGIRGAPSDLEGFNSWVTTRFYGGFDRKKKRVRNRRRLPADQWSALQEVRRRIKELRHTERELDAVSKALEKAERDPELSGVLAEASEVVTSAFKAISPGAAIDSFELKVGEASAIALDVSAKLPNGRIADPADVLSEANRDLLALLIFVAIAKAAAARGQAKVIVLDDVFQSVDSPVRLAALDHLLRDLKDWQFIVTAHDRLWREQVTVLFQRHSIGLSSYEIVSWSFGEGPVIRASQGDLTAPLRQALDEANAAVIALHAGRLLEQLSDVLSWTLGVSVSRRRGDRYHLGDLWPPVRKELLKTGASDAAQEIDRYLHLRNLLGAHPNPWAEAVSLTEVRRFAEAVLQLDQAVRCRQCGRWVERSPERHTYVCRCGATRLSRV